MAHQGNILIVGEAEELDDLAATLESFDYAVCATESSGPAALVTATKTSPELALVDIAVPGALDAARTLSIDLHVSVVYLTESPDEDLLPLAQAADPLGYVLKPFDAGQLRLTLHAALATRRRLAKPRSLTRFPRSRLLETIFQSVNEGVSVLDTLAEVRYANPAGARMFGMESLETADPRLASFRFFETDKTTPIELRELPAARAILLGESSANYESYIVPPNSSEGVFVSMDAKPLYDDEGRRSGCLLVYRDIGEQKQRELELRETAARLAEQTQTMDAVFDGIADGVAVIDSTANVQRVNRAGLGIVTTEVLADLPKWPAKPGVSVFYPDRVTPMPYDEMPNVRAMRGDPRDQMRVFIVHPSMPDGALLSISARTVQTDGDSPVSIVLLFRDVTIDHQQEQALLQAFAQGRMEVIDTVLHNVGNAANSVATGVGTLRERLQSRRLLHRFSAVADALKAHDDDWIDYLRNDPQGTQVLPFVLALERDWTQEHEDLERTVDRVADRVHHIVDILRTQQSFDGGSTERKTVVLEGAVRAGVRILEESLNARGVSVRVDCTRAPREVDVQESRFHQMLVNLVRNGIEAIDALAEAGAPNSRPAVAISGYVQDEHLVIDVTDNGIGIDPEHIKKVFTPGFTTKKTGTGLGLHSAANYVIGSGGKTRALSKGRGQGTTIRSWWPLRAMLPRTQKGLAS